MAQHFHKGVITELNFVDELGWISCDERTGNLSGRVLFNFIDAEFKITNGVHGKVVQFELKNENYSTIPTANRVCDIKDLHQWDRTKPANDIQCILQNKDTTSNQETLTHAMLPDLLKYPSAHACTEMPKTTDIESALSDFLSHKKGRSSYQRTGHQIKPVASTSRPMEVSTCRIEVQGSTTNSIQTNTSEHTASVCVTNKQRYAQDSKSGVIISNENGSATNKYPKRPAQEPSLKREGHIVKIGRLMEYGFIRPNEDLPSDYVNDNVYFNINNSSSAYLSLLPGDKVDFTLGTNDKTRPRAFNVKLIECRPRINNIWEKYLQQVDAELKNVTHGPTSVMEEETTMTEFILGIMTCTAVWRALGNCGTLTNDSVFLLISLLLRIHENSNSLKNNFRQILLSLYHTTLLHTTTGLLRQFISESVNAEKADPHKIGTIQDFCFMCVRVIPERARTIVSVIKPMVSNNNTSTEYFLHKLLTCVTRAGGGSIELLEWDELPLVPSHAELLEGPLEGGINLTPIKVKGPFRSCHEYMDTYFRLLRADCFHALKKGIRNYLSGKLDPMDMHIWRNVSLCGIHVSGRGNDFGVVLKIDKRLSNLGKQNIERSFMFGNLLCISPNGTFKDCIWSTVVSRNLVKKHNMLVVELCSECNDKNDYDVVLALGKAGTSIIMAESPTYYRAYQPVLQALQIMDPENLPFKKEIVSIRTPTHPDYIDTESTIDVSMLCHDIQPRLNARLNIAMFCESLPSVEDSYLDISQETAIKLALSKRVAIIQGPPGTGKTYVGLKLVQAIRSISSLPPGPIVILTYKNHALDEFLKNLLRIYNRGIVRIGGRSEEPEVTRINLREMLRERRMSEALYKEKKSFIVELEKIKCYIEQAYDDLNQSRTFEISKLVRNLNNEQIQILLEQCNWAKTKIRSTVDKDSPDESEFIEVKKKKRKYIITKEEVSSIISKLSMPIKQTLERNQLPILDNLVSAAFAQWVPPESVFEDVERKFLDAFSLKTNPDLLEKEENEYDDMFPEKDFEELEAERLSSQDSSKTFSEKEMSEIKFNICEENNKRDLFPCIRDMMSNFPVAALLNVGNIWSLANDDRVKLVQMFLSKQYDSAGKVLEEFLLRYQEIFKLKRELEDQHKVNVLKKQAVIGMTVTGTSINHHLLEQIQPAVIIVEEAAEVLEPQLIATLGQSVQHLILIGDHQQLRPPVGSYILEKDYHFNISLMERLINNGIEHATLDLQNRMRPEFAKLLRDIYPRLESNLARVQQNKAALCISKSMLFWTHTSEETHDRSFTNEEEANRAICLAIFLVQQGYQPRKITILAAYRGQTTLIRNKMKEAEEIHTSTFEPFQAVNSAEGEPKTPDNKIIVHTIDLYQGDENDFVIVSLVRSNPSGAIGFLKERNRRCVAQSRARCGMYFIGNPQTLKSNDHWKTLIEQMQSECGVSDNIRLHCPVHPTQSKVLAKDADDIPLGPFCKQPCPKLMTCGSHPCRKYCQPKHGHEQCKVEVDFIFGKCGHPGKRLCHENESSKKCEKNVPFMCSKCKTRGQKQCFQEESQVKCQAQVVLRLLPCKHKYTKICCEIKDTKDCNVCEEIHKESERQRQEAEKQVREKIKQEAKDAITAMKNSEDRCVIQELTQTGDNAAKYFDVEDRVNKYIQPGHKWFPTVKKIEEVINTKLEKKWLDAKSRMFDPRYTELKFHGTDEAAVEKILTHGFILPQSKNQMYGAGIYFASDSSKSAQEIYTKGSNMLLLCEVLLGKSFTAEKACNNMTYQELRSKGYDSLFAKRGTREKGGVLHDEFVVFHPDQAIPRYVIHYSKNETQELSDLTAWEKTILAAGKFEKINIKPKREISQNDPLDLHFRIAESQFLRLMHMTGGQKKITSVDLYINPHLMTKFNKKEQEMKRKYGNTPEAGFVLAFHGTKPANIENIVKDNFKLDKLASNTGDRGYYGAGIYLSEFPNISLSYGGKLLLCKVLPGKSYDCPGLMMGESLKPGFDSHRALKDQAGRGQELVIFDPDQILPCYVINFS